MLIMIYKHIRIYYNKIYNGDTIIVNSSNRYANVVSSVCVKLSIRYFCPALNFLCRNVLIDNWRHRQYISSRSSFTVPQKTSRRRRRSQ